MSGGKGLAAVEAAKALVEQRRTYEPRWTAVAPTALTAAERDALTRHGVTPSAVALIEQIITARLAEMAADLHETEVRLHAARSALAAVREVRAAREDEG